MCPALSAICVARRLLAWSLRMADHPRARSRQEQRQRDPQRPLSQPVLSADMIQKQVSDALGWVDLELTTTISCGCSQSRCRPSRRRLECHF